ncbi:uncharacterized protein KY384_001431 [Bacidia gigantensis]|uniref:uncharacterized protein n=1 Tax=Bacidia gigantensis TaxID=2732470 RepID=UPI001D03AABA|nr:uncharacterized protein KY384_001431 [Bacidia gigantensis]KAG8533690.1 hypothetical protein KY384_001431 [Bacidia gigantensis]
MTRAVSPTLRGTNLRILFVRLQTTIQSSICLTTRLVLKAMAGEDNGMPSPFDKLLLGTEANWVQVNSGEVHTLNIEAEPPITPSAWPPGISTANVGFNAAPTRSDPSQYAIMSGSLPSEPIPCAMPSADDNILSAVEDPYSSRRASLARLTPRRSNFDSLAISNNSYGRTTRIPSLSSPVDGSSWNEMGDTSFATDGPNYLRENCTPYDTSSSEFSALISESPSHTSGWSPRSRTFQHMAGDRGFDSRSSFSSSHSHRQSDHFGYAGENFGLAQGFSNSDRMSGLLPQEPVHPSMTARNSRAQVPFGFQSIAAPSSDATNFQMLDCPTIPATSGARLATVPAAPSEQPGNQDRLPMLNASYEYSGRASLMDRQYSGREGPERP